MIQKGFSLVEMVVVVAIISIMAGILILSFASAQRDAVLEEAGASVMHAFEGARNRSTAGVGGGDHGIKMKDSKISVFTVDEYNFENVERVIDLSPSIESNSSDEIRLVFKRITGTPVSNNWVGDDIKIELKDSSTGKEMVITIKKNGSINIE